MTAFDVREFTLLLDIIITKSNNCNIFSNTRNQVASRHFVPIENLKKTDWL